MSNPLPTYSQDEINQLFAYLLCHGYNELSNEDKDMLEHIESGMYILEGVTQNA